MVSNYNNFTNALYSSYYCLLDKKTICLSTADDVIKLKEYKANKRDEKRKERFNWNLYVKCYRKQRSFKGWYLYSFQEFGDVENRWFMVTNKNNEYLTIKFPQDIIVRRYGYAPNDKLINGSFYYKPNIIERIFQTIKFKKEKKLIEMMYPQFISILEKKKSINATIEINEFYKYFPQMKYGIMEQLILKLKSERNDLAEIITINQHGTNTHLPMFTRCTRNVSPMIIVKGKLFFPFDRSLSFYALFLSSFNFAKYSRLPVHIRAS